MKLIQVSVFVCLLFASSVSAQFAPQEWLTDGLKSNPPTGTVLAHYTDGFPNAEQRIFHAVCASTVNGVFFIEQIAADGTTVQRSQAFTVNAFVTFEKMKQIITLDVNETLRIRTFGPSTTAGVITGSMQCSLLMDN